jgi:hypothetical protein
VSITGRRRTGIVTLVALFAIGLALAHAPFDPGAVRLAGVALLWWYALVLAPVAGALVTAIALGGRSD